MRNEHLQAIRREDASEERIAALQKTVACMRATVAAIYPMLVKTHVHPFIEFNGLMHKYVEICQEAADQGIAFQDATEHSDTPLPVAMHDLEYLVEKLRCIFGPIIDADPEAKQLFRRRLLKE